MTQRDTDPAGTSAADLPALAERPIDRMLAPVRAFTGHTLAGAGLLLFGTLVALAWANSEHADSYAHMLHMTSSVSFGQLTLTKSLHHVINDGLMGVFFFLVGLEIKREVLVGELSSVRKAALPALAAVGGMLVPAAIYVAVNPEEPLRSGWGIPMATDIAFALGVLAVLGDRIPTGLRVLCTVIAVKSGLCDLPEGVRFPHVVGVGLLAGIGFTMALFIADLAFSADADLAAAKMGILGASVVAALAGLLVLARTEATPSTSTGAAET